MKPYSYSPPPKSRFGTTPLLHYSCPVVRSRHSVVRSRHVPCTVLWDFCCLPQHYVPPCTLHSAMGLLLSPPSLRPPFRSKRPLPRFAHWVLLPRGRLELGLPFLAGPLHGEPLTRLSRPDSAIPVANLCTAHSRPGPCHTRQPPICEDVPMSLRSRYLNCPLSPPRLPEPL